jgi:hypothetical protein
MKSTSRTPIKLQSSLCVDNPTGSDTYPFSEEPTQVVEHTGIERNGGVTNVYEQETTFTTAGLNSIITQDGSVLQVDASNNVLLNNVALGNVGPFEIYQRGMLANYLDAAWTASNTILGINKVGTAIIVDEYNPATKLVINTRSTTFASMPTGVLLNVALVKYVDMAFADAQEFVVSNNTKSYLLAETGTTVTTISSMSWTSRTSANAEQWYSVCWSPELNMFCAVAYNGAVAVQVMTSSDGITWAAHTSANAQQWTSICWSPALGLYCAVAANGAVGVQVMTSADGATWAAHSSASARVWVSVCWSPSLSLFCAVAFDGLAATQIMTSADGVTWASQTSPSARQWMSVCWSPALGMFCAVAMDGVVANQIMTSTNGTVWTSQTSSILKAWQSVCWSPTLGLFCAVASVAGGGTSQVMTSSDGVNWFTRQSTSNQAWQSVCWSPELNMFCAVASTTSEVMTSINGIDWVASTAASVRNWRSVCWSSALGMFCAVADDGAVAVQIMTSTGFVANVDTSWKFGASKYLFGRQGIASSWYIGDVATATLITLWRYAIINRHPTTSYSRAILTRNPTQVSTNLIGYGEVGYSSAGVWSATPTGYGPNLAAATATVTNPICAPGYSECTYVRSDTGTVKYYYCAPEFSHLGIANYATGGSETNTPINAYGKLTDLWNNINSAMVPCLVGWRCCMQPTTTGTALSGFASFLSAAPISSGTVLDHIGVPVTLVGEFDDTFMPHIDDKVASSFSRIIYRFSGKLFYIDIRSGQPHTISKIDTTVYQVNCLSAINVIDTVQKALFLGANDFNGRMIPTFKSGAIGAVHKIAAVMKSPYANSVDVGDKLITNYVAFGSVSVPGIELPTFIDRQVTYGADIYLDDVYENTFVSRYSYTIIGDRQGVLYVPDTRLPIAMGYTYGNRTALTDISTIFTGVGVTGQPDIDYGYVNYEVGNDIGGIYQSFVLYGQRYLYDGFQIWIATFTGSLYSTKELVCPANGVTFVGVSPTEAYFLSAFDNSLFTFDGGRALKKAKRLNDIRNTSGGIETISDGVYNVMENTLLLQTTNNFIWIRDGVVTETFKKANQTSITLYDTTVGIRIANNTKEWSYSYKTLGTTTSSGGTATSAVVPLTWQSAYHSMKGNELSVAMNWIVTLYSPEGRITAAVTLRCHSFDQDGYEVQRADYAISPVTWDALQFVRLRIQPKKGKALASSVQVDYAQHLVITDITVVYGDEAQAPIATARSK